VRHAFTFHVVPPDIFLEIMRTEDADAIVVSPEGRIGDENAWPRCDLLLGNCDGIELPANRNVRTAMLLSKLLQRLFSVDILVPKRFVLAGVTTCRLK